MEWQLCQTQYSNDKFLTALHHSGIVTTDEHGVVFRCPNHVFCRMNKDITFAQLKEKAERKIRPEGAWRKDVERVRYRKYEYGEDGTGYFSVMEIRSDDDVHTMMEYHATLPMGRQILELYVDTRRTPEEVIHLLQQRPPAPQEPIPERVITHTCKVDYQGSYQSREQHGVVIHGSKTKHFRLKNNITFAELKEKLTENVHVDGVEQEITSIVCRSPYIDPHNRIQFYPAPIKKDKDVREMFEKHESFQGLIEPYLELSVETQESSASIVRSIIPPVIRWPLPKNPWWK